MPVVLNVIKVRRGSGPDQRRERFSVLEADGLLQCRSSCMYAAVIFYHNKGATGARNYLADLQDWVALAVLAFVAAVLVVRW